MDKKILTIDDDVDSLRLLEKILGLEGYKVFLAPSGSDGLHIAYEQHPDLIILDVSMPEQSGFDVCKSLREITTVPILMLTARSATADIKHGFAVGADDYLKKPFARDELLSRVKALLRRGKNVNINNVAIKNYSDDVLKIDLIERSCSVKGNSVSLTATEFELLSLLIQHPSQTLSTRTLLTEVWGDGYSHDKGVLSLYIHQLRQKLMDDDSKEHKYIQTQWGRGYSFNPLPKSPEPISAHNFDRRSSDVHNFDRRVKDKAKSVNPKKHMWLWISLIILLVILALRTRSIFSVFASPVKGSTSLEMLITAEGFVEEDITGVRGQICVTNIGEYPTEKLSIVNSVETLDQNQNNVVSTTLNLDEKPVLSPSESHCYPYKVPFEADSEKEVKYKSLASITITNYLDLEPGTEHCPGTDPCSFGPNGMANFTIPKP
ncbi:MAG: response regulator transcription factor [Chloroflexi bacterium]|nr:response regulator transcription factor [Chloroflexota bacterium]